MTPVTFGCQLFVVGRGDTMSETIKIRYQGAGPLTVGHIVWYPGETWNVDPAALARLQADGVALVVLNAPETTISTVPETDEPEAAPVTRRRKTTL